MGKAHKLVEGTINGNISNEMKDVIFLARVGIALLLDDRFGAYKAVVHTPDGVGVAESFAAHHGRKSGGEVAEAAEFLAKINLPTFGDVEHNGEESLGGASVGDSLGGEVDALGGGGVGLAPVRFLWAVLEEEDKAVHGL